jgi:hypothetical protein
MCRPDYGRLGSVGKLGDHAEQLTMKVIGRAGTAMRVVRYERYDRLLTSGQPDSDITVVVAAHSGDVSGADNVTAVSLGYPHVWHSHIASFQFRRDVRAPSSERRASARLRPGKLICTARAVLDDDDPQGDEHGTIGDQRCVRC